SLNFAGFTTLGTINSVELYYAADTMKGPVMFRMSIMFRQEAGPLLYAIDVFQGFAKVREIYQEIDFPPGENIASVSYDPEQVKDARDAGAN
ncbi:MAG: hypothetical protein ACPGYV_15265, partial [Phycisphaeraceae bacterium]